MGHAEGTGANTQEPKMVRALYFYLKGFPNFWPQTITTKFILPGSPRARLPASVIASNTKQSSRYVPSVSHYKDADFLLQDFHSYHPATVPPPPFLAVKQRCTPFSNFIHLPFYVHSRGRFPWRWRHSLCTAGDRVTLYVPRRMIALTEHRTQGHQTNTLEDESRRFTGCGRCTHTSKSC